MLLLDGTTDLLELVTSAAADIEVHASWADFLAGAITPGRTNTASITTGTTTTIVAAPAASTFRNIRHLNIRNNHGATACDVTVQINAAVDETLMKCTLLAGETLVLNAFGRWIHYDVNGGVYPKQGQPVATQAEMETATATNRTVTPGRVRDHPGVCKFWAMAIGDGTGIQLFYNLTSMTDTGAGQCTFTIATDFSSANWVCNATLIRQSTSLTVTNLKDSNIRSGTQTAGAVQIEVYDRTATTAVQEDPGRYMVSGYGDQ